MADTDNTPAEPDYLSLPVGTFGILGGLPADFARDQVLNRAGVPQGHRLRAKLKYTHASNDSPDIDRVPLVFPPDSYKGSLLTAKDWLALIDQTAKPRKDTPAETPAVDAPIVAPDDPPTPLPDPGLGASA